MLTITHLTHIGFHGEETLDFNLAVSSYLESIADDINHIINFVNIRNDSIEDRERRQDLIFFEKLRYLLMSIHSQALKGGQDIDLYKILEFYGIPKVLFEYLQDTYLQEMDIISGKKIHAFGNMDTGPTPEELESDEFYGKFRRENFLEIIEAWRKEFKGNNIFNLATIAEDGYPEYSFGNPERFESIFARAQEVLGLERVKQTDLYDGQLDEFSYEQLIGQELEIEGRHVGHGFEDMYEYGNAETLFSHLRHEDGMKRMEKVIQRLNEEIGIPAFLSAKHVIGGEYLGRCVDQQESFVRWLQSEQNPVILPEICLIHPDDI